MDLGLAYNALANGDLDTIAAQATDGQIAALGLKVLKDDKGFFPNYALTPVVRKEVLDANPDLKETLEAVSMKLDDATMRACTCLVNELLNFPMRFSGSK